MKKVVAIVLVGLACATFFLQYHRVNAGIAREFEIDEYQMSDPVFMERVSLQVMDVQIEDSYDYDGGNPEEQYNVTPVRVSVQVQNLTDQDVELGALYELALHQGAQSFQTYEVENKVAVLSPSAVEDITFIYSIFTLKDFLPNFTLAISQQFLLALDTSRFQEKWDLGKIHGITIDVAFAE